MKKLLFLYPVKEYFWYKPQDQGLIHLMNRMINLRYRKNGYQINYLVFANREVHGLNIFPNDRVLKSNVEIDQVKDTPYTDNELIEQQLGSVDELVVCGFHEIDCVRKVARYFNDKNVDTLVDIELTDALKGHCKLECFNPSEYNLANIIECRTAEAVYKYGDCDSISGLKNSIYAITPYYRFSSFSPTHTWKEYLKIMEDKEDLR